MAEADVKLTSPYKHIRNASTRGTILTENQLETGKRSPTQPKLQERALYNQSRMGEKSHQDGTLPLGVICKEEKVHVGRPSPWGSPLAC